LIVVARGLDDDFPTFSEEESAQLNQLWHKLQQDLVKLVPDGQLIIAEDSHHNVHLDQPEVVIAAIHQMVETVNNE
jgi:pimeloyl-ACP methyl ester carboxylesterase